MLGSETICNILLRLTAGQGLQMTHSPTLLKDFGIKGIKHNHEFVGGVVASWLVCSTSVRAAQVRALAGDIVLCSWARHFTLTVPLSTQVYNWVPANCWGKPIKLRGSDL